MRRSGEKHLFHVPYRLCNKRGIIAVRCVPIASVENSNGVSFLGWEASKKSDKSNFIIDLRSVSTEPTVHVASVEYLELWS